MSDEPMLIVPTGTSGRDIVRFGILTMDEIAPHIDAECTTPGPASPMGGGTVPWDGRRRRGRS